MKKLTFSNTMIIATILGFLAGIIFKDFMTNFKFLGDIFLRLMQMSVVLLIMGAIIESVGALKPKDLGTLGLKTIVMFLITTVVAASVGILVVNLIQPGEGVIGVLPQEYTGNLFEGNVVDLMVDFVPRNIMASMSSGNIIQVIVFAIFFGLAISFLQENEDVWKIYQFIQSLNVVIMQLIKIVMKFAPIGVFALLANITGTIGFAVVVPLFKFLLSMFLGSFLVIVLFLGLISIYAKINPFSFLKKIKNSIIVSATTTSSAISLPIQMEDCEERLGISRRVSRLVNPLAMTLNSDGLALTISIACIMIAQFYGIQLSLSQQIVIVAVSTLTTMGNLLVPGGALVAIAIAFQMVGLPLEGVALLAGVDWFAGIARTLLNVIDDILVAFYVAVSEKEFNREIFDRS